jgi:hypothetical protein
VPGARWLPASTARLAQLPRARRSLGGGTILPCRDDLLGGLKERRMGAVGTGTWGISAKRLVK